MTKTVPKNNHCTKKPFYQRILSMIAALALIAAIFPVSFSASAASNEETIYNYLTGTMHLNQAAASGALANIYKESSFNPNATGDGGTSYGICQWHNERWTSLKNYCNNNGYDWTTLNGQLHYLDYELKNYYPGVYSTLTSVANTADGAYNAGYKWCYSYEIPANKEAVSVERGNLAKNTYWPKYGTTAQESWLWPVAASKTISSNFGMRYVDGAWKMHTGIDISCSIGTAVRAAKSGVVYDCYFGFGDEEKDWSDTMRSFGNYIAIKHTDGTYSLYAHLKQQQLFSKNDTVSQGQTIAYSGNSGASSGPHCHFQATKNPSPSWGNAANLINTMPTEECISQNGITVINTYVEASGYSTARMNYIFSTDVYTITLDPGAGTCSTTIVSVPKNSTPSSLPTPELSGYTFNGWYTKLYDGTQVTTSTTITANMRIHAHWTKSGTKISFDPAGGVLGGVSGTYMLDGINVGRGVGKLVVYTTSNSVINTNAYGCEVAVDSYGHVTQYRPYGSQTPLTVPWGGFILSGHSAWDEDTQTSCGGGPFVASIGALSDPYVRIDYETGEVRAYNGHAAYMANEKYVTSSGQYGVLPVPTKTGYYFDGWYTGTNGTRVTYGTTYTSNSLTAKWTQSPIPAASVSYNGHWYEVYDSNMTWKEAKALCESLGGYLACITTAGEQSAVLNLALAGKMNLYYIGATDEAVEGTWRWVSGETFQYNNWDPHLPEPSNLSGENYSSMMTVDSPPNKHVGEWIDCYNMTCGGIYDYSNCGFICEYNVPHACSHTYTYSVTTAPTTSAAGVLTGTCPKCGDVTTITLPKLNTTDYSYTVTNAPTCTATGTGRYTWKTTTYGTFYFDVTIPKTVHNYQTTVTPPTCTAQGYTTHTCSVCGDSYKDSYTNAVGHAWNAGVITKPATETETGIKTFTCTRCGETKTELIPKLDGKVNPFVDVAKGKYYYDAVLWAYYHEPYQVTGGTDATHFSPNKTCTREQVVSFLYAANGKPEHHMTTNPFTDVKAKKYYYNAVMWAVENKITGGVTETTFGIGKPCTREQVVTFLWKAAGAPAPKSTSTPFTDVKAGKYYYNAVLWAVENKITGGTSATTFGVGKPCTRAQVVTFLYAAMGKAE